MAGPFPCWLHLNFHLRRPMGSKDGLHNVCLVEVDVHHGLDAVGHGLGIPVVGHAYNH